jgi:hypothetical protein
MPSQINLQIAARIRNMVLYKRGDKYYARSVSASGKRKRPNNGRLNLLVKHSVQKKFCDNNYFR